MEARMSSKKAGSLVVLGVALLAVSRPARAVGDVHFALGTGSMQDGAWRDASSRATAGVSVLFAPKGWPIRLTVGTRASSDGSIFSSSSLDIHEWDVGVAK